MFKKKGHLLVGTLCVLMAALLVVPVSAHGCHGGRTRGHHGGYRQNAQITVTVCPYDDCTVFGRHSHSGILYCGYDHGTGVCDNNCQALCPLEDCETLGRHVHGLSTYCGYNHEAGFCDGACRALCPYEDCSLVGYHSHGGVAYCGDAHEAGFCDSCCHRVDASSGCCHLA